MLNIFTSLFALSVIVATLQGKDATIYMVLMVALIIADRLEKAIRERR